MVKLDVPFIMQRAKRFGRFVNLIFKIKIKEAKETFHFEFYLAKKIFVLNLVNFSG